MIRVLLVSVLVGTLTGCIRPEFSVCSTPNSCVVHVCEKADTCTVKPVDIKGL